MRFSDLPLLDFMIIQVEHHVNKAWFINQPHHKFSLSRQREKFHHWPINRQIEFVRSKINGLSIRTPARDTPLIVQDPHVLRPGRKTTLCDR